MKKVILATLVCSVLSTAAVSSYAADKMEMAMPAKATASNTAITGKGQVVLISKDKTMVTLKHDPIAAIQWPAMTMAFKVKNSAVLSKTKVGDKVSFTLSPDGKDYMVTSIK